MRLIATAFVAVMVGLGFAGTAKAGVLELPFDRVSLHRNCAAQPCLGNALTWKRIWVRDKYLRFSIHTTPAHYAMRRQRVISRDGGYEWVTTPVLVSPAHNWVTRRAPYYAYFPETIAVIGR